ncbi:hypothetical protein LTR96_002852 [Exophiala xenobiotica]|nr:hypothetical protein LTR96_002852 [Exophiala xenobiotica]KAK5443657.1 hypothetical protein LTR18_004918 [Exophiala xenobiotica]KAK5559055.1 hypothetical protein LTR46_003244 [Exophiala xenobiotica]
MSNKPVIIFVPGAWHPPSCFQPVMDRLEAAGYETHGVSLPSVGAPPEQQLQTIKPDVEAIQDIVRPIVTDQGKDVLLVFHSYGGVVGGESVQGLEKASREKEGKRGGISHLYYCCAFALPEGVSLMDALQGKNLPWFRVSEDQQIVTAADPDKIFYNDLPEPAKYTSMPSTHSYQTFHSKVTYPAWKYVPSTYLFCERDMAIPLHAQKGMVENSGVQWRVDALDASHSPFLSMPDETAHSIRRAAGEVL